MNAPDQTPEPEEPTLDTETDVLMTELHAFAIKLQKHGQAIAQQDYSDGVNVGSEILGFVSACQRLADKFDEVGLFETKAIERWHI